MKYIVSLKGKNYEVEVEEGEAVLTNISETAKAAPAAPAAPAPVPQASVPAASAAAPIASVAPAAPVATEEGAKILAPMSGIILSVNISAGQDVKAGDVLLVLEAMKMENDIVAPSDGTVKQVLAQKGMTVDTDDILAVIG